MQYYVLDSRGNKEGPLGTQELQDLIAQKVLDPSVLLQEVESGKELYADQIPELDWEAKGNVEEGSVAPFSASSIKKSSFRGVAHEKQRARKRLAVNLLLTVAGIIVIAVGITLARPYLEKSSHEKKISDLELMSASVGASLHTYIIDSDDKFPLESTYKALASPSSLYYIDTETYTLQGKTNFVGVELYAGKSTQSLSDLNLHIMAYTKTPVKIDNTSYYVVINGIGDSYVIDPVAFNKLKNSDFVFEKIPESHPYNSTDVK